MKFLCAAICLVCVSVQAGERPDSAPPIDHRLTGIEDRLSELERDVESIKSKLEGPGDNAKHCDCPCPDGVCICKTGECPCEDCPKHKSNSTEPYTVGDRTYYFKPDGSIERCVVAPSKTTATSTTPTTGGDCGTYRNQSYQGPGRFAERQRTGHYEYRTQCQGGFCRRVQVWVAD